MTGGKEELVVITGSSGLIGRYIIEALAPHYTIVGLDIKSAGHKDGIIELRADLTQEDSTRAALGEIRARFGNRISSLIHLAAHYDFSGAPSPLYQTLTVDGTRRLLDGLAALEIVPQQIIYASSLLVMRPAETPEHKLDESDPVQPEWEYPRSKYLAEKVLREQSGDIPLVIHRISGVYDEWCNSIPIGQQIRRIYEKQLESFFFPGDLDSGQPFVHLRDLAQCFKCTVERRSGLGRRELFLVAEDSVMSYRELQDCIGNLIHGRDWPTIRIPKFMAKAGAWVQQRVSQEELFIKPWMIDLADDNYPVEIKRARERLGWEPEHLLRDILPEMIENLRRDPLEWYSRNKFPLPQRLAHGRDGPAAEAGAHGS